MLRTVLILTVLCVTIHVLVAQEYTQKTRHCPNGIDCPPKMECCMKRSNWLCCYTSHEQGAKTIRHYFPIPRNVAPLQHG
uniref:Cysteine rich secreted protein n=1 Tax=Riptortus pedestris TaxID=329032 RepID=R4WJF2_RIPPE|nr:cysteine rich secreted protein [Riptortus pedestris]